MPCILACVILAASLITGCASMKADMFMKSGKYAEAVPLLEQQLAENPADTGARSRLGFAFLKTGDIDRAVRQFERVLESEPDNPYALLYLGIAFVNQERFGEAIETWKRYRDRNHPRLEAEIRRQLTLLLIAESQRRAEKALAEEEKLKAAVPPENTVAVCYYADRTPGRTLQAFQKGLAAMVMTDLSKIKSLQVVERMRLQALLEEMQMGRTGIVDTATAPRVGRLLGARHIIVGSLTKGSIRVTTSLSSTETGRVEGTSQVRVSEEHFYDLPKIIVTDTAKILGIELTDEEKAAIGRPHTTSYDAMVFFGRALEAMDAGNWKNARDLFARALAEDPNFKLAGEAADACPGAGAPSVADISQMTAAQVSAAVESAVSKAAAEDAAADDSSSSAGSSGGDGGGEGDGGDGY